jgi:hypothetical protein
MNSCDSLRDEILPKFGVRLYDRAHFPSVWIVLVKRNKLK